jgi:hypothetical protein
MSTDIGITTDEPAGEPWLGDAVVALKAIIGNQDEQLKLHLTLLAALFIQQEP